MVRDMRDLPYGYKGEETVVPKVTTDFCPACDKAILDATESARVSAHMQDFQNM